MRSGRLARRGSMSTSRASAPPVAAAGKHLSIIAHQDYNNGVYQYDRFDSFIAGEWSAAGAASDLTKPVLIYMNACVIRPDYFTCMDINYARAQGFILKNSSNVEIGRSVASEQKIGDIGSTAFRDAWVSNVVAYANARGVQGVFIDNVERGGTESGLLNSTPVLYPSQPQWENAMVGWVLSVVPRLRDAGLYTVINAAGYVSGSAGWNNAVDSIAYSTRLASAIADIPGKVGAGYMVEYWPQRSDQFPYDTRGSGTTNWFDNWEGWVLNLVPHIESLNTDFWGLLESPAGDSQFALYAKASLLLVCNRPGSNLNRNHNYNNQTTDVWGTLVGKDLGAPLGVRYQVGSEWRRDFAGGTVRVNPVTKVGIIP